MKAVAREARLIVPAVLALFVGVGILSVFLLQGESSRNRILVEYEADRMAASLADTFRVQGQVDEGTLDPRVRGFALYDVDGDALVRVGQAPTALDFDVVRPGFDYDLGHNLLVLERIMGMGGPGMMGPGGHQGSLPPMMRGGSMGGHFGGSRGAGPGIRAAPGGPAGGLFLSMDISSFRRSQVLYGAAAVASPFVVAGLAAVFLLLLASNIRHRRRAQEQETLARLGEGARTLAHEIRNPLAAIRIQTGLLRKSPGEDPGARLNAIDEEVQRLSLLSRRVSDFLKNPSGDPVQIPVDTFLRDLAARLAPAPAYRAEPGATAAVVRFDADMLRSVVENLVRNAYESYPESAVVREAELALTRDRGSVVISVRDRGKGIPADLVEKVFDPFYTDKVQGSGVGLSLSRRFVEAAGGSLRLLAREGGGTEARITLPPGGTR